MKKIILCAVLMLSFSSFADEVYDVDGAGIDCNSEVELSVSDAGSDVKVNTDGTIKE